MPLTVVLTHRGALAAPLHELFRDDHASIHAAAEVVIVCWYDAPTLVQLREMERLCRPYEANVPGGCGLFNIVKCGRPNFTPEIRKHTMRVASDGERFQRFRVHEVLLEGIRSATVQLFLNTAAFVLRPPSPSIAVRTVADACAWAAPRLASCGWTENELLRAHDHVLARAKPSG